MSLRIQDRIFSEAREKQTPEERRRYLDEACGGNVDLRSHLEALLQAHEQAGDFLEVPALGARRRSTHPPCREGPGTVIDRYKLLEKIGEGGMAVVYMAEQEQPVRRKVALKIIKLGMDTTTGHRPLRGGAAGPGPDGPPEHRQGLRRRHHGDRPALLRHGTGPGRLHHRVLRPEPAEHHERLELFVQVCQAVQHAHQKGIIHRDIKPSNVLVTLHDGKPVPKVIDFGIAKATDQRLTEQTLFTRYAQMIGTPEYMSPEQAELSGLDIDTRTDIYSLGVLLYELLTGTTPFSEEELRKPDTSRCSGSSASRSRSSPRREFSTLGETLTEHSQAPQ